MRTSGNTILITGGGSGIGRALARRLDERGDTVIVAGRRRQALDETIAGRERMSAVTLDVDDPVALSGFAERILADHPQLNVLINNAGVMREEDIGARRDLGDAEETIRTNLVAPIRLIDAFLDHLSAQADAAIVNVTSGLAFVPTARAATYCATKVALHSYTLSLRHKLAGRVEVIELIPPGVQTDLTPGQSTSEDYMPLDAYIDEVMGLFARQPTPAEIAVERVAFLRGAESEGRLDQAFAAINPV